MATAVMYLNGPPVPPFHQALSASPSQAAAETHTDVSRAADRWECQWSTCWPPRRVPRCHPGGWPGLAGTLGGRELVFAPPAGRGALAGG
ncbi:hypothetical protein E2C01_067690 [Portunus trituberculatus]|uniref:Uncharacterized protein n=1 Tax=Portunus trituberculatus TaxID=210409 RepID=A0A5B7HY37_PORTR|nr:hypothetical protein [Portunus trituberculatus]